MTLPATVVSAMAVQYQDGLGDWVTFGVAHDLGTILRSRRFALAPRHSVTAQHWRVVRLGVDDLTGSVMSLDGVAFWAETNDLPAVKLQSFAFDVDTQRYVLVCTPGNIEIYQDRVRQASIPTPYTADQVPAASKVQELDTYLSFHFQVAPLRITRQGANTEWDSRDAVFTNVPLFDYDGTNAGAVNEVQQLFFDSYVNGDTFNITLEQYTTDAIVFSTVAATMEASLTAALVALQNVGAGGVTVTSTATNTYSVEFVGANAGEDVGPMAPVTLHSTAGGVFGATLTQGVAGGEPVFSASRGYPACGAFYQQRLYLGGLASQPQSFIGSVIGDFFNLNNVGLPTAAAIYEELDTDEATFIRAMYPGQHLQILTSSAEFYCPVEPIVSPAAVKLATRRGMQPNTPQGFMDGATVFVTRGGGGLARFVFDVYQQTYTAPWINVLAPHLVDGVIDMAFRRALSPKESDLALLVRSDGLIAAMMALMDQNVVGFSRWTTDGTFLAASADIAGDMYVAVKRTVAGGEEICLEAVDAAAWTDGEVLVTTDADPITEITGLDLWEGQTRTLMIDGLDAGDAVITGGTIVLPFAALSQAAAGRNFVPTMTTLPITMEQDPRPAVERDMRAGQIAVLLGPTANVSLGLAGGKQWRAKLKRRPDILADGADPTPFTGWARVADIEGFTDQEAVQVSRPRPGPFNLRALTVTVDT